jgi:hypothetical protein
MTGTAVWLGLVVSLAGGALILGSLARNPRLWLGDAPRAMREAAAPLSSSEKRQRWLWGIPLLFVLVAVVPLVTWLIHRQTPLAWSEAFWLMWLAWMVFNLFDLIVIDWLTLIVWCPRWSMIREVEHLYHLNSFRFHARGFLIGTALITVFSLLLAWLICR